MWAGLSHLWYPLLRVLLAARAGQELLLVLDSTPLGPNRTVVLFGLVVHKRILPLIWHPLPSQSHWPVRQQTLLRRLGRQLARVLPPDCPVWDLVTRPGQRWAGTVEIFQAADWRVVHLTIVWPRGCQVPWLLISDRPAGPVRIRE